MECVTLRTQHVTRVESTSNSPGGARARYAFIRDPFCFPDMRDIRNQLEDLQSTLPSNFIDDRAVPHQTNTIAYRRIPFERTADFYRMATR